MSNPSTHPITKPILIKEKGHILILQKRKLIPSGGNTAYFLGRDESTYELYRERVWALNDVFFYPFSGKECEITGELDGKGKIMVHQLRIVGEGYIMQKNEHLLPKTFMSITEVPLIRLNEHIEIQVVKNLPGIFDSEASRLYLKIILKQSTILFVKLSMQQLELFFANRISLLELIRLREDESIYREIPQGNDVKLVTTYSKIETELDSYCLDAVFFFRMGDEEATEKTKDQILKQLRALTKNGILGIYHDVI